MLIADKLLYLELNDGTWCPVWFEGIDSCEVRKYGDGSKLEVTLRTANGRSICGVAERSEYVTVRELFTNDQWTIQVLDVESCDFSWTLFLRKKEKSV